MPTNYHREDIMSTSGMVPGRSTFTWRGGERLPDVEIGTWSPFDLSSAAAGIELSRRGVEVVLFLPCVLAAGEIAGELHVSINTIKAHRHGRRPTSARPDACGGPDHDRRQRG